jgi:hypothetical protein
MLVGEFSVPGIISVEIRPLLAKDSDDAFKISEYGQTSCRHWHAGLEWVHLGVKLVRVWWMGLSVAALGFLRGLRFKFEMIEEISKNGTPGCLFCFGMCLFHQFSVTYQYGLGSSFPLREFHLPNLFLSMGALQASGH